MIEVLAKMFGVRVDQAEDAMRSERGYHAALSRRDLFAAGGALAAGSVFSFPKHVPMLRIPDSVDGAVRFVGWQDWFARSWHRPDEGFEGALYLYSRSATADANDDSVILSEGKGRWILIEGSLEREFFSTIAPPVIFESAESKEARERAEAGALAEIKQRLRSSQW